MLTYNSMRVMYNLCTNLTPNRKVQAFTRSSFTLGAIDTLVNNMSILDSPEYLFVGSKLLKHVASIVPDSDEYAWAPTKVSSQHGLVCEAPDGLNIYSDAYFQVLESDPHFLSDSEFVLIGAQGSVVFGDVNLNI